ncbi:MAG TPA: hypothetical protein G4O02_00010 [Caldilineae bacterium]|nr:hypothetical protein [Caldilineae bacterium]
MIKLRQRGWSTRRIAEVIGVGDATVRRDLAATASNDAVALPDRIIGKDGKNRPAKKPKPAPPPSVIAKDCREAKRVSEALADVGTKMIPHHPLLRFPGQ